MADHQRPTPCEVDGCGNPAQYQCLNCEDVLCIGCKEKHKKKRKTHKFVLYSERMKRICKSHSDNQYVYWCKTCSMACCVTCVVVSHNGHVLVEIEDAICKKKKILQENLDGPFQECLTQWKNLLLEAKETTTVYRDNIQKMEEDLVSHANRIHEAVDESLAKIRNKLKNIREIKETTLQAQEKSINDKYEQLKRHIEQLEELVQISDISLLEHKVDIADMKVLPTLTRPSPPSYILGQIDDQMIETMIGKLNSSLENLRNKVSRDAENVTPSSELIPQASATVTRLMSTPVVVSSIRTGNGFSYCYPHIACTASSGLAWVTTDWECIHLMDNNGKILDTINTGFFFFSEFTTTLNGDLLITGNRCITSASKRATSWRINTLFHTRYASLGICSLSNGDVVVTSGSKEHRVIQYSTKGKVVHEFDPHLFSDPCTVAVNKLNEDLYVCDALKGKVSVFGKDHGLRYTYTGYGTTSFIPWDVSTDNRGHVLITDNNNYIHILDKEGNFLQYLQYFGLNNQHNKYVDVDSEGCAWIGEEEGEVKIVKY